MKLEIKRRPLFLGRTLLAGKRRVGSAWSPLRNKGGTFIWGGAPDFFLNLILHGCNLPGLVFTAAWPLALAEKLNGIGPWPRVSCLMIISTSLHPRFLGSLFMDSRLRVNLFTFRRLVSLYQIISLLSNYFLFLKLTVTYPSDGSQVWLEFFGFVKWKSCVTFKMRTIPRSPLTSSVGPPGPLIGEMTLAFDGSFWRSTIYENLWWVSTFNTIKASSDWWVPKGFLAGISLTTNGVLPWLPPALISTNWTDTRMLPSLLTLGFIFGKNFGVARPFIGTKLFYGGSLIMGSSPINARISGRLTMAPVLVTLATQKQLNIFFMTAGIWDAVGWLLQLFSLAPVLSIYSCKILCGLFLRATSCMLVATMSLSSSWLRCWIMFGEHNGIRYSQDRSQIPIWQLLLNSITHIKAIRESCNNERKKRRWTKELDLLIEAAK